MSYGLAQQRRYVAKESATCASKAVFKTRGKAIIFAALRGGDAQTPYQCKISGNWHLTSQERGAVANAGYLP